METAVLASCYTAVFEELRGLRRREIRVFAAVYPFEVCPVVEQDEDRAEALAHRFYAQHCDATQTVSKLAAVGLKSYRFLIQVRTGGAESASLR